MNQPQPKPFCISKHAVYEAWRRVRANRGSAGIDDESVEDFERKLKDNLYRLWNRMSSGSYFPPPVRTVSIPKAGGGERKLGIPTVADRVAQMVVKMHLEPEIEPKFHPDSYGYRPGRGAHEALGRARQRCWQRDWVLDLDIKGFFDHIPHDLLLKAVRKHARERWVVLYIERWLKAPARDAAGHLALREQGTPQGGVISPLLANLFLHYGFDLWMDRNHPDKPFERYADDAIVHCCSRWEAERLLSTIVERLGECGLELNGNKTRIVYCKDANRIGSYEHEKFTFLGYEFRARTAMNRRGVMFTSFLPAISEEATKQIRAEIRRWKLPRQGGRSMEYLVRLFNPQVRGWVLYYGRYYPSRLYRVFAPLDDLLARWACRKYKKLRKRRTRGCRWLGKLKERAPELWAHWQIAAGNSDA